MENYIAIDDVLKLDIRMGTVQEAMVPEGSRAVVKMEVDFGERIGRRTIFAGIKASYEPELLVGKQLPFIINLQPKRMGELGVSEGMLFAVIVEAEESRRAVLLEPQVPVENGSIVR
jgi:methionine--tRNA ligase beta chain